MTTVVGVDSGQGACRLAVAVDGRRTASGEGPGFHYVVGESPARGVLAGVEAALAATGLPEEVPSVVCLGMTGACGTGAGLDELAAGIRKLFGPVPVVRATGDHVTSFAGALGLRAGSVVAAGTGVIALGVNAEGRLGRADGWGYLFGDDGGGFWIGRRGFAVALRAVEGRGPGTGLVEAAAEYFGGFDRVHSQLYREPGLVRKVAGFTRAVASVAREGDPVAAGIWQDAGAELARTCAAARRRAGCSPEDPVSHAGALFDVGALLTTPFRAELDRLLPGCPPTPPAGTGLDGAVLLARSADAGPLREGVTDHRA